MSGPAPTESNGPMLVVDTAPLNISEQVSAVRADLLNAGANNTSAVLQNASADTQSVLETSAGSTATIIANSEREANHTQAAVDRSGYNAGSAAAAGFFEARGLTNASSAENRAAVNLNSVEGRAESNRNFFENRNTLNNGFTANLLAAKDGQLATVTSEGNVRQEISNLSGLITGQLTVSKDSLHALVGNLHINNNLELSKYFGISERESNKQFALAALAASANAAKIEGLVEECCCDVKSTVVSTANDTQALVQNSDTNRIREDLASVQLENVVKQINPLA